MRSPPWTRQEQSLFDCLGPAGRADSDYGAVAVLLILLAHRPQAAQTLLFPLIRQYEAKKPDGLASVILVCARLSAACSEDCRPHFVRQLVLPFFCMLLYV